MQQTKLVLQYIAKINELNDISITNILQIKKKKKSRRTIIIIMKNFHQDEYIKVLYWKYKAGTHDKACLTSLKLKFLQDLRL